MEILNLTANYGSKDEILKGINALTVENCKDIFADYVDRSSKKNDLTDFEKGYIKFLEKNIYDFGRRLIKAEYKNKTKDQLLAIVEDWAMDGPYSFQNHIDNYELHVFIDYSELSREDKLKVITDFMTDKLNEYCEDLAKTQKEKNEIYMRKELEQYRESLKRSQERIAQLMKELGEV